MKILLTGGTGFVGSAVLNKLVELEYFPAVVVRSAKNSCHEFDEIVIENINSKTDWKASLSGCDVVIHCAARVHIMNDKSVEPLEEFREVNTFGTLNLARSAARQGVKRFIFVSSIKVLGEKTSLGFPFKSTDTPKPEDPYGISKFEAEEGLKKLAKETEMEIVIIRPPLVYGPGVKGNFASLLKFASKGIPLPFGSIKDNLRSIVSIDNLVDLIITCIKHTNAANRVFLVSDDEDMSTSKIFQQLSESFGKSGFMFAIPVFLYAILGKLAGKSAVVERLCGNLQVDITDTKSILGWKPVITSQAAFVKTAKYYLHNKGID